jgi:hypothetical protein
MCEAAAALGGPSIVTTSTGLLSSLFSGQPPGENGGLYQTSRLAFFFCLLCSPLGWLSYLLVQVTTYFLSYGYIQATLLFKFIANMH